MQAPRCIGYTGLMPSQASQLPPLTEYKRAAPIYLMHCDPTVGAGLLAKAVAQSAHVSLTHRFREQARSHFDRVQTSSTHLPDALRSHKVTAFNCQ